jgi:2-keto-3-deoxy-L-rhamnonate aldolase RhmA
MLRQLASQRPIIGTFLKVAQPDVVEILAIAGLDFVICDMEHAQIDEADTRVVIQAGRAAGLPVIVRVPTLNSGQVNRLLEAGAAGIQLSSLTSQSAAADLFDATTYPPQGRRGVSTAQAAARYGTVPLLDYMAASNAGILRIGQLESAQYEDSLDDIMSRLDVAFIGTMDLSVELGHPGRIDAFPVQQMIADIEAAAQRTATPLGIFATSVLEATLAVDAGYRYVAVSSDLAMLARYAVEQFSPIIAAARGHTHG